MHYEHQATIPANTRTTYGMHKILRYMHHNTVRDDEVSQHVIEHSMLLRTRPQGMNIYN